MKNAVFNATSYLENDLEKLRSWQNQEQDWLKKLPLPTERSVEEKRTVRLYFDTLAEFRARIVAAHGNEIYSVVTNNFTDFIRVEDIVYRIAEKFEGLAPTNAEILSDAALSLKDKEGHELSQGLVLSELLAIPAIGHHLMAAMRRCKIKAHPMLAEFQQYGFLQLETLSLTRKGNVAYLSISNRSCLNAEDDQLNTDMEYAADVILLDHGTQIAVIRGDIMDHHKYKGKRVFCSGVNLTKLYRGQLPYLFYVSRELGLISKIYRGLLPDEQGAKTTPDCAIEKPWISVVDSHAIGGGFQMLMVSDYVLAEKTALLSVPARREGFIPGLANLRLPRYVGQRLANKLIYNNYEIIADSDEGRKIVDEVAATDDIEASLTRIIDEMTGFGITGLVSNRKAFRLGIEPLPSFLEYMATFCREQAKCMYGSDIVNNLESFWVKRN